MIFHAALCEFYLYTSGIQNTWYELYINVVMSMHNSFVVSDFVMTPKEVNLSLCAPWRHKGEITWTAPVILNHGTRTGSTVNFMPWPLTPGEKSLVFTEQEVWWTPEPVWMFWRREKSLNPARSHTTVPHLSRPQPSHYTNYATLFPIYTK